jgi:hypothetical protein
MQITIEVPDRLGEQLQQWFESRWNINPSPSHLEPCVRLSPHTAPELLGD